jgi:cytochrome P450
MKHSSNSNTNQKDDEYPPGPTEIFPYGLALKFISNPLPTLKKITFRYGDVSHFKFGPRLHVYLINDPHLIENILVRHDQYFIKSPGLQLAKRVIGNGLITNEGENHLKQRRLVQQAFTRDKVEAYGKILAQHYLEYTSVNWKDGMSVNIHREMTKLTLSIISKLLFGNNSITLNEIDQISDNITLIIEYINKLRLPFLRFIEKLPIPSTLEYKRALKQLDKTIYAKIDLERQNMSQSENEKFSKYDIYSSVLKEHNNLQGQSKSNILSILINSTDGEARFKDEKILLDGERKIKESSKMNDKQLRDEVMTIFLAGHETTANALTWSLYLLSCHPDVEVKMLEEISLITNVKEGNINHKEIITVEDLPRLKYTEKVLMESMRLYPPSWAIGRQTIKDYTLNDKYIIPARAVIIMSQYLMHHDSRYFSDPEKFIPERWSPKFKASIPRFSYFPFGGGQRSCIGEPLAWSEGIIILSNVINRWKITLEDEKTNNIRLQALVTLRPKDGIKMKMSKR